MQNLLFKSQRDKSKEEHDMTVKRAHDALAKSDEVIASGKERLENALKRYQERGKPHGPSKLI